VPDEAFQPIIVQHGLQDFIYSRPIDRRDMVSAALGLDSLTRFKAALDRARIAFRNRPPATVALSLQTFQAVLAKTGRSQSLSAIHGRWSSKTFDSDVDLREIHEVSLRALDRPRGDWPEIRSGLLNLRDLAAASVFDPTLVRPLDPHDVIPLGPTPAEESYLASAQNLAAATRDFLRIAAATYRTELLRFWEQGLALTDPSHPDKCPMCEANTLILAKREELASRIQQNRQYQEALTTLRREVAATATALKSARAMVESLLLPPLGVEGRARLQSLMEDQEDAAKHFIAQHDEAAQVRAEVIAALDSLDGSLTSVLPRVERRDGVSEAQEFTESLGGQLSTHLTTARQAAARYTTAFRQFEPILAASVATQDSMRDVDALIAVIDSWKDVATVAQYVKLLDETQGELRDVELFLQRKQAEIIASRGEEIEAWYCLMNPGACVTFAQMEPATDAIRLHGNSFGRRIGAAACFSASQLNCLGLSFQLMRALNPVSPFGFLLLDDPIQSLDEDHCETLMIDLLPRLLDDHARQVLFFSHLRGITDRIRALNLPRAPLYYSIESYGQSGPVVVQHLPLIREFKEVRDLARGNEGSRSLAVDRLRLIVERLVRELHLLLTGTPLPPEYDHATAPALLRVFKALPGTTPAEHQGLAHTVQFSDPSHHTETNWQVPTAQQIEPHIQRLQQIANHHGLLPSG